MSKTLKLVLKRKWYEMIDSGEKTEEYRDFTDYWKNRLLEKGRWDCKLFDSVTFYLGYAKNRPSMSFKWLCTDYGKGKPEWGAEKGKDYFIIKLGKRL